MQLIMTKKKLTTNNLRVLLAAHTQACLTNIILQWGRET